LLAEQEVVYQSKANKKTEKLIDRFVAGDHDRFTSVVIIMNLNYEV